MILKANVNCLPMTHLCFLQFMALILPQMTLIMIQRKLVNGLFSGKLSLTQITPNRLKKKYLTGNSIYPVVCFTNIPVNSTATHKHLGIILDSKLSYENHLQSVFSRANKTIGLLRKFQRTLPRISLGTIYKSFIRPHLDYGMQSTIEL